MMERSRPGGQSGSDGPALWPGNGGPGDVSASAGNGTTGSGSAGSGPAGADLGAAGADARRRESMITAVGCTLLFLLGLLQGLIGSFQYSGMLGPVPAAALGFDVLILATCVLGSWGMRRALGGIMPAVGWFAASFVLSLGTPGGSVLITNTTSGKWYLFGGTVCVAAGVVLALSRWSRGRAAGSGYPGPAGAWAPATRKPGHR
jgi:hypothetical protein